ncbi:hypothetical protein [Thermococcus stetteri]|uniref:hypothetical protein n=1 Tax=Thermococcus stetteri TaxID=49900 RepID=UPI001AE6F9A5|nr:hypothetical protein [Thermococcus stetteri]MBP1912526.1 hypothetical protein [Thermococcus stetteri]
MAMQTQATKESIEEMKTQRLINVILPASSMLLEIKDLIKDKEECLRGREDVWGDAPWRDSTFGQLRDLKECLKRSELTFVASLIPERRLYQALEEYQTTIISLREAYGKLSYVLDTNPKVSETIHTIMIESNVKIKMKNAHLGILVDISSGNHPHLLFRINARKSK